MSRRDVNMKLVWIHAEHDLERVQRRHVAEQKAHRWPVPKSAVITWSIWLALTVGSFAVIEWRALHNARQGDTLSEVLRLWWHTHTIGGKVAWYVVSVLFAAWFIPHVGANDWLHSLLS